MTRQIQWVSTFVMVLIWSVVAQAQGDSTLLSFENALQMMQNQNPALLRARQQIKQKESEKAMKQGLYLPQISVGVKAVSMSDPITLDLTPVRDAIAPIYDALGNYGVFSGVANPDPTTNAIMPVLPDNISTAAVRQKMLAGEDVVINGEWDQMIQEKNFVTATADFIWPVFTGGKIKGANKAAEVDVAMVREDLRKVEGELLTELVTRYYGLALAVQVVEVRRQMFEAMDRHYSDAQKLFNEGIIAKVEFLHASVARNEAERELKQSQRNVEIVQSGLFATLALDSISSILPASHLFVNKELLPLDEWVFRAYESNPQLKQVEGKKELVNIKTGIDKGNYLPTVAMLGTFNLAEKNLSPYTPNWLVGVGLKWNVFEGFARHNQLKASTSMMSQVDYAEQQAHDNLRAYLTKLYHELNMQLEQIKELESTLELANEYCVSTEKAFDEGFAASSLVVDAHTKITQVKAMRLKVFYEYDVTLSNLFQTAGIPEQFIASCSGENTIVESLKSLSHE
ncbi:MAG: TolC family protein [Prolixibacteraceae bacterium]